MQLITTRNKEISFAELKKAISSGNGLELIRQGDKFAIELKNGEHVNAVCGGYVNEKRARFVLEDCLADKWRMNDTPTNKGGYLKSEGRRHVLEDILPLFPDELAEAFDMSRISKSPAIFDPLKLRAINAAYIRALPAEEFRRLADPFIDSAVHCDIDRDLLCANLQPRCEVLEDIPPQLDFFDAVLPIDAEMYRNKKQKTTPESAKEALTALLPVLEAQTDWTRDAIFEACKTLAEQMEKKNGWLLFPLGIALSGKTRTPGGGTDLAAMMGREETLKRVKDALGKL